MCGGVSCLGVFWLLVIAHPKWLEQLSPRVPSLAALHRAAASGRFNPLPTPLGRRRLQ